MFIITNNNIRKVKSRIFPLNALLLLVNGYKTLYIHFYTINIRY